ncbi:MAG: ATP-binding protein, partial [Candidatus Helarchaeota archaeon]
MQDSPKIGIIVGESSPTEFIFATTEEVERLEYIYVKSNEHIIEMDGGEQKEKEENVKIIAQIFEIFSHSKALPEDLRVDTAEKILAAGLGDNRTLALARVLGFIHNNIIYQPRRAIQPGKAVYKAPKELLEEFYSSPKEAGLDIGHLITRLNVPVKINVSGFRRHLAILAQTGAGKSYTAGVLIEELYNKGGTIVVIDPHADYVLLGSRRQ